MNTIHWGIIGVGDVCEKKAGPALYGVEHSQLVAVTRRSRAKGEDWVFRHGHGEYVASAEELLRIADIDAVYVSTPDAFHEEPTIAAARAGKHVLVEKAMAPETAACDRMIEACRESGVTLAVAYYRRCFPTVVRAKDLLTAGTIGDLRSLRINDGFPESHRLDLIHFFGGDIAEISLREEVDSDREWSLGGPLLHCTCVTGITAVTHPQWNGQDRVEKMELVGSDGIIRIDDLKAGQMSVHNEGETHLIRVPPPLATHWGLVENFVSHLRIGTPLACSGEEGRKSTVILDQVNSLPIGAVSRPVRYG